MKTMKERIDEQIQKLWDEEGVSVETAIKIVDEKLEKLKRSMVMRFEPINGDDPNEPDCLVCYNNEKCTHKDKPCTFETLMGMD